MRKVLLLLFAVGCVSPSLDGSTDLSASACSCEPGPAGPEGPVGPPGDPGAPGALAFVWGRVGLNNGTAALSAGRGVAAVSRVSNGQYRVQLAVARPDQLSWAPIAVALPPTARVSWSPTNGNDAFFVFTVDAGGAPVDAPFVFWVVE